MCLYFTHFKLLQVQAEDIITLFQERFGFPSNPPIPVEIIARGLLGLRCESRDLKYLGSRTRGILFAKDRIIHVDQSCNQHQYAFTIAHEIGHWVLHEGHYSSQLYFDEASNKPLSLFFKGTKTKSRKAQEELREIQANWFAGAMLVPRTFLFSEAKKYKIIDTKAVNELAEVFGVSREVMIYRIKDLYRYLAWDGPNIDLSSLNDLKIVVTQREHALKQIPHPNFFEFPLSTKYCKKETNNVRGYYLDRQIKTEVVKRNQDILSDYLHRQRKAQIAKRGRAKPIVVEFTGTPNAGKDTLIRIAADRLKDIYGYRVEIVGGTENPCDTSKSWDIEGLYLKVANTAAQLIEAVIDNPKRADIIIINKGLFDAVAFVHTACERDYISTDQKHVLTEYLLCDRVLQLIDEVFLFLISPAVAIKREYESKRRHLDKWAKLDKIEPKKISTQRVINETMLGYLNTSFMEVYQNYYEQKENGRGFGKVHLLDFRDKDDISIEETVERLAKVFPKLDSVPLQPPLFSTNGSSGKKQRKKYDLSPLQLSLF